MGVGNSSGALNPVSERAELHAKTYYEGIRKRSTDILRVSENTGLSLEIVSAIKSHIFYTYHNLESGFKRFDPSYEMAESWRRLSGNNPNSIQSHDITMLRHELCEMQYMLQTGASYYEAHDFAQARFNYAEESNQYYARIFNR